MAILCRAAKNSLRGTGFKVLSRFKNAFNHPPCWDHGLYVHKLRSFPPNRAPKMREIQQLFLGLRVVSRIFEENQLWRIFSTNKSATANRKKGFYINRDPNKQEVGFIFV